MNDFRYQKVSQFKFLRLFTEYIYGTTWNLDMKILAVISLYFFCTLIGCKKNRSSSVKVSKSCIISSEQVSDQDTKIKLIEYIRSIADDLPSIEGFASTKRRVKESCSLFG